MTKIFLKTWGCSLNKVDSEFMAGLLKEAWFEILDQDEEADIVILNSCSLNPQCEQEFFNELKKYKNSYKIIILAGCIPQIDPEQVEGYSLIGTRQIHKIVEVVEEALNNNPISETSNVGILPLSLSKLRTNPIIEIVPICRGCLSHCSFCQTKTARGKLISYKIDDIKLQIKRALSQGAKEVWLTAPDCGCYGIDINTDLAELLNELTKIEMPFKIRVGNINLEYLLKIKDKLIQAYQNEKVFKFLHLPVQSGNNKILRTMKRHYTIEDFKHVVDDFRKAFPVLTLATDIIVGFPSETEEQYWDTLNLVREISPDVLNISPFWSRPNTLASEMTDQLPEEEVKRRFNVINDVFNNTAKLQNERWLGWEGEVLIDEENKENKENPQFTSWQHIEPIPLNNLFLQKNNDPKKYPWIAHNFAYKPILLENTENIPLKLGDKVKVRIDKISGKDLIGKVI